MQRFNDSAVDRYLTPAKAWAKAAVSDTLLLDMPFLELFWAATGTGL